MSVLIARVARAVRLVSLIAASTVLLALINPVPAAAHVVGTGGSPTNYRTTVTAIRPALPTVVATVGLGGQFVRITNQGAATIVILGYRGEPFLRLVPHLVEVNQLSDTAAQTGLIPVAPAPGSPAPEPRWVRSSDGDSVAWTDARIAPPPRQSQPASESWTLPLLVDGQQVSVVGTRDWIPSPSPWPWVMVLVLLTAAVATIGWMRNWHRPMAAVVTAGILAFALHVLGTGFAPQQNGPVFGWVGVGLVTGFALLVGAVSAVSALRGSESAPDRAVTAGGIVLILAAADISVLWNSQLPFPGPGGLDRGLTVISYAAAIGLIIAGARLVRLARSRRTQVEGTSG
ncbi:MAG: hypothetical protein QOG46_1541 [Pseudonocardiales bacterium]|nr:hypothetical protein [Pseudonocardiales bacterium]